MAQINSFDWGVPRGHKQTNNTRKALEEIFKLEYDSVASFAQFGTSKIVLCPIVKYFK